MKDGKQVGRRSQDEVGAGRAQFPLRAEPAQNADRLRARGNAGTDVDRRVPDHQARGGIDAHCLRREDQRLGMRFHSPRRLRTDHRREVLPDAVMPQENIDARGGSRRDRAHRVAGSQGDQHLLHTRHHVVRHLVHRLEVPRMARVRCPHPGSAQATAQAGHGHVEPEPIEQRIGRMDRRFGPHDRLAGEPLGPPPAHQRQALQQGRQLRHQVVVRVRDGAVHVKTQCADAREVEGHRCGTLSACRRRLVSGIGALHFAFPCANSDRQVLNRSRILQILTQ